MEDVFELDPACPYWQSDFDAGELLEKYKLGCGGFSDWLDRESGDSWYSDEPRGALVYAMRGHFEPLIWPDRCHQYTFTPGAGGTLALVIPVVEDGRVIDLVAMAAHHEWIWACVTGRGTVTGNETEGEPLRIYKTAWQWLLWDCDGVLPLDKSVYPGLAEIDFSRSADNRVLLAEGLDHADELIYRVYAKPAIEAPPVALAGNWEAVFSRADAIEDKARTLVCVDTERFDITREKTLRAEFIARQEFKEQGIILNGYRGKSC